MKNIFKKKIKLSDFIKSVLTLMTGTAMAQAIPLLASPIISRLYTPNDFAVLALYLSVYNLIQIIVTGRYDMAVMLPRKDNEAINLISLSLLITGIISTLSLIILYPLNKQIGIWLKNEEISKWIFIIPFAVLVTGIFKTISYWLNRKKNYKLMAESKISRSATNVSINIGLGKIFTNETGLVLGQFLGDIVSLTVVSFKFFKDFKKNMKFISFNKMKQLAKKYKDFPTFNSLQAFSDQSKESGIIMVISYFFLERTLGLYSFGLKYTKAPISLLTHSLSQVIFQNISSLKAENKALKPFLKKLTKRLALISLSLFIGIFFFIEDIIAFIFGENWRIAGTYVKLLAPFLSINFISSTLSFIPIVLKKQKQFLFIGLFSNITILSVVFVVSLIFANIEKSLIAMSAISSVNILLIIAWFFKIVNENDKKLLIKK